MEENTEEKYKYGSVVVGCGLGQIQKELAVIDFVQSEYKDHRLITTALLEDNSYIVSVENPESSGRNSSNTLRLSEESYIGLVSNAYLYFTAKGMDMEAMLKNAIDQKHQIEYSYSDNLIPIDDKK
jgi:hypothetical protein